MTASTHSTSGAGAGNAKRIPLPPGIPEGADPDTYHVDSVTELLHRAAYFSVFSVADESRPSVPVYVPGTNRLAGMEVHENLHRFDVFTQAPDAASGMRAINQVGQQVATVHIHWLVAPDDFEAAPGRRPPPTALDYSRSQRFVMLDGEFKFLDREGSGFHGFGAGRTMPAIVNGRPQLRIGSVVEMLEGFGKLRGHHGNIVVNGYLTPPNGLALDLVGRAMDLERTILTSARPGPLRRESSPDPETSFLYFIGERDPDHPITLNFDAGGSVSGAHVTERLRLIQATFDVETSAGLRSRAQVGQIAGSLTFDLDFNSFDPRIPFPLRTRNGFFRFFDLEGRGVGTVGADVIEGRAFRTAMRGGPTPIFRIVGFGPIQGGTGCFAGASGVLSVIGAISVFPRSPSLFYAFRLNDPAGRFRV